MKSLKWLALCITAGLCLTLPPRAVADIDTFEDGTTQNWRVAIGPFVAAHPAPPVNVASGGPGGADDNYMLLTSIGGGGAGSRLSAINTAQWTGDFVSAGIITIAMDLNNFGTTDLHLRLLFADPFPGPPANTAISTDAIVLPAGGGWTSVVFPIRPDDLTATEGNVLSALTGATEMRIFENDLTAFPPRAIVASLGVDNIEAIVPVPSAVLLAGLGFLTVFSRRKRGGMNAPA